MVVTLRSIVEPTQEPVTLAEAKRHCVVEHDQDDALLQMLISAARQHGENITRRSWAAQTLEITYIAAVFPAYLYLRQGPVQAIVSVTAYDLDDVATTVPADKYTLYQPSDVLDFVALKDAAIPPGTVRVVVRYLAGWSAATLPAALKQWLLVRVGTLYSQREAVVVGPQMLTVMELSRAFADSLLDRYTVPGD